jgi:hypothetical protein
MGVFIIVTRLANKVLPSWPNSRALAWIPDVFSQGFDMADARLMVASAPEDILEGKSLPVSESERLEFFL